MKQHGSRPLAHPEIDALIARFFSAFSNKGGKIAQLELIFETCIAEAVIIKNSGMVPEVFSLDSFIEPRRLLLQNGDLLDFEEYELQSRTQVLGRIAQRTSLYRKSGLLNGTPFTCRGVKSFQLINTASGWKISALAWDDERDGFIVPETLDGV